MRMRVLLVEPDAEEALLLRETLAEVEALQPWRTWVPIEALNVATCDEALAVAAGQPMSAILLGDFGDSETESFRRIQSAMPDVPIVLLIATGAEDTALRLVREGAQDFLVKKDADAASLAHALRNSVERQRLLGAARAGSAIDSLTGIANRASFLTAAERDCRLAERLDRRWMLLVAEPRNVDALFASLGADRRDLTLVETADHLRSLLGPVDLLARIAESRFAIGVFDNRACPVESSLARLQERARVHRIALGSAMFGPERPCSLDRLLEMAEFDLEQVRSLTRAAP